MSARRAVPRRDARWVSRYWVLVLVAGVLVLGALPAASFSTGTLDRGHAVDVVDDQDGALGLVVAASVRKNEVSRLVDVTNHFPNPVTVTVSLPNGDGTLYFGTDSGTTVSDTLGSGATGTVEVDVDNSVANGYILSFTVTASGPGTTVTADRSTTVEQSGGGNCQGNNPNC